MKSLKIFSKLLTVTEALPYIRECTDITKLNLWKSKDDRRGIENAINKRLEKLNENLVEKIC
jgi:hypothetical protein